jgi:squalene/oxidosqualene cyclase-like protein
MPLIRRGYICKLTNSADQVFRAQLIRQYLLLGNDPPSMTSPEALHPNQRSINFALHQGMHFYSMLQSSDGHWSGDCGGPHFLLPGLVIAWYVMGQPSQIFDDNANALMRHYIIVHQQSDGGWGIHIESPSTMCGTTLNYVAIRLLGVASDDPVCIQGRAFMHKHGGALMTSSWAKFYLCLLGVMHWDGHNSVPPEMWLLPNWFPFHPGRMWGHSRMVYLPMGYIYGHRVVYEHAETDPLTLSLRDELYLTPYDSIVWMQTRHYVADIDNYSPIPPIMKLAQNLMARYETWSIFRPFRDYVRRYGLLFCLDYMKAEDLLTNFINLGPVDKVLHMVCMYHAASGDVHHPTVACHFARVADYLWLAEDGLKMKIYNGTQCWDTSFAVQAMYEANLVDKFPHVARRAWNFLERTQILSTDVSRKTPAFHFESAANRAQYYHHVSEGGWPFSTSAHGWALSDATGEGLKAMLCLRKSMAVTSAIDDGTLPTISNDRLEKAVNLLLSYQNEDGGFATYENTRGFRWYECLNPSEVFGDLMIDYSYVECSMTSLTALHEFHIDYPGYRANDIIHAMKKGREFLVSIQRPDGSWYGSWACCFCYASWFGIEGLVKCGEPTDSQAIQRACEFLLVHQRPNGGWGEDFSSCYNKAYAVDGMAAYGDNGSSVVSTSWALLALAAAKNNNIAAVRRGVQYLIHRQLPSGDWPQEGVAGVGNRTCGLTYASYRNIFPIWCLGRCHKVYGDALDAISMQLL